MGQMRYSTLVPIAASAILAAAATPAGASPPHLAATVTRATAHNPYPRAGALITVAFTVGEPGQPPGSGVPAGSVFEVELTRLHGTPTPLVGAGGENGRYNATIRWPGGRIRSIRILSFLNTTPTTAQGGFWLPVTVLKRNF